MDGREARRVDSRSLVELLAKGVMLVVADRRHRRLGRLEAHVVPAEVLEAGSTLAEALRTHGRARGTLAGEKPGREGSERLGFAVGHLSVPLLADHAAAETTNGTRTGLSGAGRRSRRCEHRPAEILLEAVGNIFP